MGEDRPGITACVEYRRGIGTGEGKGEDIPSDGSDLTLARSLPYADRSLVAVPGFLWRALS